jgi:hypothetical protein
MNKSGQESGRYVYCIIKSPGEKKSFGNIGFGGEEVYTLEYRDFAPVVSSAPVKKYEVSEEEVEIHKKVVQQVMHEYSVIPTAYGMVFKNKKLITVAMSAGYKAIKKSMQTIDHKIELGIKVVVPKEFINSNGKTELCQSDFLRTLKEIAVDSKELKLFSERLVLNASFLVDRDKVNEFSGRVEHLGKKYDCMKIQYSGPWPPYNFVDIHILSKRRGGIR